MYKFVHKKNLGQSFFIKFNTKAGLKLRHKIHTQVMIFKPLHALSVLELLDNRRVVRARPLPHHI